MVRLLLIFTAIGLRAQPVQPDTQTLLTALKSVRQEPGLGSRAFGSIQKSLLEWIDVRLRNLESINALNRELADAGAFDPSLDEPVMRNFAGFLDEIRVEAAPDDLLALRLGIGTTCAFDETIVVYQRQPWKRIAWLNHGDLKDGVGYVFSAFTIGPKDAQGRRLVVAGEYDKWCTSTLIRANFRIDALDHGSLKPILNRDLDARRFLGGFEHGIPATPAPIAADISGNVVSFRYFSTLPTGHFADAVQRYRIDGGRATPSELSVHPR